MTSGATPPAGINVAVASTARIYDFWLGGKDNFAADRAAALAVTEVAPEARLMAVENRKFLRRAVRYLAAEAGITQFLDIGTGLPTQGNVHQVAQEANPAARVVYVDNDPMVISHSRALNTGENTAVIEADPRLPQEILDHRETRKLIDFSQPLAVLLVAVLHFIGDDDDPGGVVAAIRDAMAPGSYLVVSHVTSDIRRDVSARAAVHYKKVTPDATLRSREEILRFFAGLDLIEPGKQRQLGRRHSLCAPDAVPPGSPARYTRGTSEVYRRSMPRLTTLRTSRSQAVSPAASTSAVRAAHRPTLATVSAGRIARTPLWSGQTVMTGGDLAWTGG